MEKHDCIIGIYYDYDDTGLATANNFLSYTYWSGKSLEELTDPENQTPFKWFNFCPICGKRIDKEKVRKEIMNKVKPINN